MPTYFWNLWTTLCTNHTHVNARILESGLICTNRPEMGIENNMISWSYVLKQFTTTSHPDISWYILIEITHENSPSIENTNVATVQFIDHIWQYGTLFVQMLETACWLDIRHHISQMRWFIDKYVNINYICIYIKYYDLWWFMYIISILSSHPLFKTHIQQSILVWLISTQVPGTDHNNKHRIIQETSLNIQTKYHLKPPQPARSNRPTVQPVETGCRGLCSWSSDSTYPTDHTCLIDGAQGFQVDTHRRSLLFGDFCIQNLIDQHLRWAFGNLESYSVESCLPGSGTQPA